MNLRNLATQVGLVWAQSKYIYNEKPLKLRQHQEPLVNDFQGKATCCDEKGQV
jgi:hypothetical protein